MCWMSLTNGAPNAMTRALDPIRVQIARILDSVAKLRLKTIGALCLFVLTPEGITNRRLRPLVAQLLGVPDADYTARKMGYDLRRLKRKGLIQPVVRKLCYTLTPQGRRVALFLTKVQARILRPGLQALDLRITSATPRPCAQPMPPSILPSKTSPGRPSSPPDAYCLCRPVFRKTAGTGTAAKTLDAHQAPSSRWSSPAW
jgi:hypothetical protein